VSSLYVTEVSMRYGPADVRFDAQLPVRGTLTLTVQGPPRHYTLGAIATLPNARIEGQLCGDPIRAMFRGETREIDFL
jgi:hypothetical protein